MADGEDEELELEDEPEAVEPEELAEPEEPAEPEEGPREPGETPPEVREPPVDRQPSRRDTRIQALTDQIKDRDTRLAETNRRLDELSRQMTQPRAPQETAEQRAARFALMTPLEQMDERLRESEQRIASTVQQAQMTTLDATDRATFQSKYSTKPEFLAKWGPKVEAKIAENVAKGQGWVQREIALKFLVGEAALERLYSKEAQQETRQAARRVANQRTRPANSGSDTAPQRRQTSTAERRLENVQI